VSHFRLARCHDPFSSLFVRPSTKFTKVPPTLRPAQAQNIHVVYNPSADSPLLLPAGSTTTPPPRSAPLLFVTHPTGKNRKSACIRAAPLGSPVLARGCLRHPSFVSVPHQHMVADMLHTGASLDQPKLVDEFAV
jgi:hypothetical protein